jgi:hypothetical protein
MRARSAMFSQIEVRPGSTLQLTLKTLVLE